MSMEQPTRGEQMAESIFSARSLREQAKILAERSQEEKEKSQKAVDSMKDFITMVALSLGQPKYATSESVERDTKADIIAIDEEDYNNKEYIIRIEVRDTLTGEKTKRSRLKISDSDEGVSLNADLGFEEVESPAERVHAALFTHLVQATTEFIEDDLIGE